MVNMEFDGKAVSVPEGMTLVDAAATVGVHIPNLCHIKELRGVGACRMCMVEIEGMKTPVTGCTTRTKEGMKVQTKTAKVEEIRKFVTDLVLSFHPLDCMTCPKAGACDLQRYAADLGIRESSFGRKSFNYELNDKSPFITIDNNYCILCGRCVRVCKEQGTNVLDFMGRGITTKVSTALDKPLHESGCTFCGSCVDACPVNTIMERDRWQHGREWDLQKQDTVCTACGSGCSVMTSSKNGKIVKVNAKEDNGYICAIGRFGFDALKAGEPHHHADEETGRQAGAHHLGRCTQDRGRRAQESRRQCRIHRFGFAHERRGLRGPVAGPRRGRQRQYRHAGIGVCRGPCRRTPRSLRRQRNRHRIPGGSLHRGLRRGDRR